MLISKALLSTSLSQIPGASDVGDILSAALTAADPKKAVLRQVRVTGDALMVGESTIPDFHHRRKIVLGFGKASVAMAAGIIEALPGAVSGGAIITKSLPQQTDFLSPLEILAGSHPVPAVANIQATQILLNWTEHLAPDDLVFCLVSGGGSALFTSPVEGVSLEDIQKMTRVLLACGASIQEINSLRKHLDRVKGGGLARRVFPATLVTLILSDVVGNPLDVIASGPTIADPTTYHDALEVIYRYQIAGKLPARILHWLHQGECGQAVETVKPGDACLKHVKNVIVASNEQAAAAAVAEAQRAGFEARVLTTSMQGEARKAGQYLADVLKAEAAGWRSGQRPLCLIAGGETTVTLRGQGKGGRNQELALAAVVGLRDVPNVALVTLATDGEDGPTDACGAVVTGETWRRASRVGMKVSDFLANNNAYEFFERLGDLILTGPSGTNVNDLAFLFCF